MTANGFDDNDFDDIDSRYGQIEDLRGTMLEAKPMKCWGRGMAKPRIYELPNFRILSLCVPAPNMFPRLSTGRGRGVTLRPSPDKSTLGGPRCIPNHQNGCREPHDVHQFADSDESRNCVPPQLGDEKKENQTEQCRDDSDRNDCFEELSSNKSEVTFTGTNDVNVGRSQAKAGENFSTSELDITDIYTNIHYSVNDEKSQSDKGTPQNASIDSLSSTKSSGTRRNWSHYSEQMLPDVTNSRNDFGNTGKKHYRRRVKPRCDAKTSSKSSETNSNCQGNASSFEELYGQELEMNIAGVSLPVPKKSVSDNLLVEQNAPVPNICLPESSSDVSDTATPLHSANVVKFSPSKTNIYKEKDVHKIAAGKKLGESQKHAARNISVTESSSNDSIESPTTMEIAITNRFWDGTDYRKPSFTKPAVQKIKSLDDDFPLLPSSVSQASVTKKCTTKEQNVSELNLKSVADSLFVPLSQSATSSEKSSSLDDVPKFLSHLSVNNGKHTAEPSIHFVIEKIPPEIQDKDVHEVLQPYGEVTVLKLESCGLTKTAYILMNTPNDLKWVVESLDDTPLFGASSENVRCYSCGPN